MTLLRRASCSLPPALISAVLLVACGGDGSGPVTASTMSALGGTSLNGTVGQALLVEVVVTGSNGKPFAGGVVSFSVTSGGGSASPSSANTDQTGKASTTWTLGTTSGAQGLSASSGAASVQFTAQAQAGLPASVEAVSSFPGRFPPGEALAQPATFVVRDQYNNPVQGVSVAFSASNGGSASPVQGTTGSDGRVSTTWTLGPVNGIQTLSATVQGVAPAAVTAEAFDACSDFKNHSIGQTANGTITSGSCEINFANQARFADLYTFSIGASGGYRFNIQSDFTDPLLLMLAPSAVAGRTEPGNSLEVKALLDNAGSSRQYFTYVAGGPGGVGSYQFSSQSISAAMVGCETWVATKNISTNQALADTDCYWDLTEGAYYVDLVEIWLDEGETLVTEMTSPNWLALDPYMELMVLNNEGLYETVASNDDVSDTDYDSRIEYTVGNGEGGFYFIGPSSFDPDQTGSYTLIISSSGGSESPPEMAPAEGLPLDFRAFPPSARSGDRFVRPDVSRPVKRR